MDNLFNIACDVLLDAAWDTLMLVPFLLLVYLLMEWIEHKAGSRAQEAVRKAGPLGPVIGALLGALPQCGFSAAGATLYAGRVITIGTLMAVFLSTSDELLPIMIAEQAPAGSLVAIIVAKILVGMIFGIAIDAALRLRHKDDEPLAIHEICAYDHCECSGQCSTCSDNPELAYEHDHVLEECEREHQHSCHECQQSLQHAHEFEHVHEHEEGHNHEHHHAHQHTGSHIVKSAVKHTVQVSLFIFVVSVLLGALFELVGEDALAAVVGQNQVLSVLLACAVGLVPNCAASVAIIQLYLEGVLGAGAMFGGLLVSAGVGLLVLCRTHHHAKKNVAIIGCLYAIGALCGLIVLALGIAF